MGGRFLLDTNVVIALFKKDPQVEARLGELSEVFVSSITIGELHFDAMKSGRPGENATQIDAFAESCIVVDVDVVTARRYGLQPAVFVTG